METATSNCEADKALDTSLPEGCVWEVWNPHDNMRQPSLAPTAHKAITAFCDLRFMRRGSILNATAHTNKYAETEVQVTLRIRGGIVWLFAIARHLI